MISLVEKDFLVSLISVDLLFLSYMIDCSKNVKNVLFFKLIPICLGVAGLIMVLSKYFQ